MKRKEPQGAPLRRWLGGVEEAERWYEFDRTESFTAPVYVKARSIAEARARRFTDGISDYLPTFPQISISARGRIVKDQAYVDHLAAEVES